jgi:hypothetical protein
LDRELSFERVIGGLCEARILRMDVNGASFNARFSYCYFLANYFKLKMDDENIRNDVNNIVETLYHRESANILLFLSHLAPGAWPLDLVIQRANDLFADAPLWNLETDVEPILRLGTGETQPVIELPDSSAETNSKAEFEYDDECRRALQTKEDFDGRNVQVAKAEDYDNDWEHVIREVRSAYKLIKIMGQVLKNNVDSMEGEKKKAIVESVFRLSRRMLGEAFSRLLEDFTDRREYVLRQLQLISHESGKRGDRQALIVKADRELIGVSYLACFAVTRNVADAVGAQGLQKTYKRVLDADNSVPNRLYHSCLAMENSNSFPVNELVNLARDMRNNWFGIQLLNALVAYHFYMYDRPRELRQSVLAKLEIGSPKVADPRRTMKIPPRRLDDRRSRSRYK